MQTRTYTEKSNARRACRAAGLDPDTSIVETEDGFEVRFPGHTSENREAVITQSFAEGFAQAAVAERANDDQLDTPKAEMVDDADGIPAFCKIPDEQRKKAWITNPPRVAHEKWKEAVTMAKTKAKQKKAKGEKGADKTATLLSMLKGKGSTVEAMTKALGWLPHTLRARISRLPKPKKDGGEGIKIERERVDGVTSYRIAS